MPHSVSESQRSAPHTSYQPSTEKPRKGIESATTCGANTSTYVRLPHPSGQQNFLRHKFVVPGALSTLSATSTKSLGAIDLNAWRQSGLEGRSGSGAL